MEVAAYLADKAGSVTVIGKDPTPFANIFGIVLTKVYPKSNDVEDLNHRGSNREKDSSNA